MDEPLMNDRWEDHQVAYALALRPEGSPGSSARNAHEAVMRHFAACPLFVASGAVTVTEDSDTH